MKIVFLAAFLVALSAQVARSAEQVYNTASVIPNKDGGVVTIHGDAGIGVFNNDKVELKDRVVYVNERSFGAVPETCEIKYVVTGKTRTLYVDGKVRATLPGK
jgi:hypothetical protein